jgi:hypothetical protein
MADDDDTTTADDVTDGTGTDDTAGGDSGQDGDGLGDAGRAALKKERDARKAADRQLRDLRKEFDDFKAAQQAQKDGDDAAAAAEQARRDAETAALAKANARILAAEVRAAAAGKLADPADAARYLDMSEFEVGDDGTVDSDAISEAISDLIKRKPYLAAKATGFQGTGDGGARANGSKPRQVTDAELKSMSPQQIVKARQEGRLTSLLGG